MMWPYLAFTSEHFELGGEFLQEEDDDLQFADKKYTKQIIILKRQASVRTEAIAYGLIYHGI